MTEWAPCRPQLSYHAIKAAIWRVVAGNYIVQESNRGKMDHRVEERVEFCPPMKGLSDKDMLVPIYPVISCMYVQYIQ